MDLKKLKVLDSIVSQVGDFIKANGNNSEADKEILELKDYLIDKRKRLDKLDEKHDEILRLSGTDLRKASLLKKIDETETKVNEEVQEKEVHQLKRAESIEER